MAKLVASVALLLSTTLAIAALIGLKGGGNAEALLFGYAVVNAHFMDRALRLRYVAYFARWRWLVTLLNTAAAVGFLVAHGRGTDSLLEETVFLVWLAMTIFVSLAVVVFVNPDFAESTSQDKQRHSAEEGKGAA